MRGYPRSLQALLICVACAGATAQAAPDEQPDAMLQLLQQRGLLAAGAAGDEARAIARQVRSSASGLVVAAMNFLGAPYRRGGNSPDHGFDCSGFTRHVFERAAGLVLPRRADQQASDKALAPVDRDQLEPGDLVFFDTMRRAFSHVGIYVGDGRFIHAPRSGAEVRVEDMRQAYWSRRFNGARRAALHEAPPTDKPPGG